jgi:hypothetical protein
VVTELKPTGDEPQVLLRALTENARDEKTKRYYGKLVLTDHGDHVKWTNGKTVWRWRLADQGAAHPDYPILAGIVLARFTSALGIGEGSDRIIFVSPDGAILAHFSPLRLVLVEMQRIIMPLEIYYALAQRGVTVTRESFDTEQQFYRRHSDATITGFSLSFANHPVLWLGGVMLLILAVVNIVLLLNGYYS